MKILIIGGGIAGIASAIALSRWLEDSPQITVLEIRSEPSTIGGAIGLTPNALRCLNHLGAIDIVEKHGFGISVDKIEVFNSYSKALLGQLDFVDPDGTGVGEPPFKGRRILRSQLLQALLEAAASHRNVNIIYGEKMISAVESEDDISVTTEGGRTYSADIILGCDGIHSAVRKMLVDKDRSPEYTGIAAVAGFADMRQGQSFPWKQTGLCQTRRGSLMATYFESSGTKQALAVITEMDDVKSRDGWIAKGVEQDALRRDIQGRYGESSIAGLQELIADTTSWTLYPVYKLGPRGIWSSNRALLLGDAAHAMPPQGESAAIAMEDAIIFARILSEHKVSSPTKVFGAYEAVRRARVDRAYQEATFGWDTQKDSGWLMFQLRAWLTSVFLWWTAKGRRERYSVDLATVDLELYSKS